MDYRYGIMDLYMEDKQSETRMSNEKQSIVLRDDGHLMFIDGDIAHADYEIDELYRQDRITKEQRDAVMIHIHYWRESKAGVHPPRPYWKRD